MDAPNEEAVLAHVRVLKHNVADSFAIEDHAEAFATYSEALDLLDHLRMIVFILRMLEEQRVSLLLNVASCKIKMFEFEAALSLYEQALKIEPNNARPVFGRGQVHLNMGNYSLGVLDEERAAELDPECGWLCGGSIIVGESEDGVRGAKNEAIKNVGNSDTRGGGEETKGEGRGDLENGEDELGAS
ncbi:hypothetical protein RJT34_11349 [Clitoria ternatea]|uniref:Uncharacterized protein n=1 Tax=Clitoria ternatea TaxID=43366 RepID=A0AAN9JNG4_CLITE